MDCVQRMLTKLFRGLGSPLALRQLSLMETSGIAALTASSPPTPNDYADAESYRLDAQAIEITRKLLLPGDTEKRRLAAVATFWSCEAQNAATNTRLRPYLWNSGLTGPDEGVMQFITAWRKELKRVLGKAPDVVEPRFSGGSTLSDTGVETTIPDKMSSEPTLYSSSRDIARLSTAFYPVLNRHIPVVVRGNRFFTVPKDSQKDRGCCVESSWNISLQLGVGQALRRRYKSAYDHDLRHMQDEHRELARWGSETGLLATIDLSNASDNVSTSLVKLVMPDDWWALLNSLRARTTEIDGKTVWLEKFSSMGNGFTFELESIIFRSLAAVVSGHDDMCSAYGDDILIRTQFGKGMIAALRFFGFIPNAKKTFLEGPFRESCGGDFFDGVPVRAHYLTELPDGPQAWVALANGLRRFDPSLRHVAAAWHYCVDQVPSVWRNFGPKELGDLVIYDPEAKPQNRWVKPPDYQRLPETVRDDYKLLLPTWRVMRPVGVAFRLESFRDTTAAIAAACYGVGQYVTLRDRVKGFRPDTIVAWGLANELVS